MVPSRDMILALLMGAGLVSVGLICYTAGGRHLLAAETTLLNMLEVVLAPLWGWLLLAERVSGATLVGGAIIIMAVAGNALFSALPKRAS